MFRTLKLKTSHLLQKQQPPNSTKLASGGFLRSLTSLTPFQSPPSSPFFLQSSESGIFLRRRYQHFAAKCRLWISCTQRDRQDQLRLRRESLVKCRTWMTPCFTLLQRNLWLLGMLPFRRCLQNQLALMYPKGRAPFQNRWDWVCWIPIRERFKRARMCWIPDHGSHQVLFWPLEVARGSIISTQCQI